MSKLLEGKLALVLGIANKWSLAYSIAQAFSREGASLTLTYLGDRQKQAIEDLSTDLNVAAILTCDVTRDEDLARPFLEPGRACFLLAQDVSAYSLVAVARSTAPLMTDGGSLTTLTYVGSTRVLPGYNVMGVAKASLEAAMRYLASELGPRNIRVNAISAGPVKTVSARAIKDFSTILDAVPNRAPLRRNTEPAEVADAALSLVSDLGLGVTCNILFVDAGMQVMGL